MYGPDVFAVLSPCREQYWANTIQAFSHSHNAAWLDRESTSSRQPTPALSPTPESEDESANRLVLKFGQLGHCNEVRAGTDKKLSHILLKFPGVKAVSARQFVIVVRPDYTVYLKDRLSRYGTRVAYNGKEDERKDPHGEWILADQPAVPERWNELVIRTGNLAYTIEFPNHAAGSSEYLENLETLRERENTEVPLFGALDLHSNPTTAAPSEPFTPQGDERQYYLYLKDIASSRFGTVQKLKDTRDQQYYVKKTILKYPRPEKLKRKRKRDGKMDMTRHEAWFNNFRAQMTVLQTINHVSLMTV